MLIKTHNYSMTHINECLTFIKNNYNHYNNLFYNLEYTESDVYAVLLALRIKHELATSKHLSVLRKISKWCELYGPSHVDLSDYVTFDLYTTTLCANLEYLAHCRIDIDATINSSAYLDITPFIRTIELKPNLIVGITDKKLTALCPNVDMINTKMSISHDCNPETRNYYDIDEICWMAITHKNDKLAELLLKNTIWHKLFIETMEKLYNDSVSDSSTKQYILGIYNKVNNLNLPDSTLELAVSFDLTYNNTTNMLYANTLIIKSRDELPHL